MSSVTIPEARLLVIKPYDKSMLKTVEKAILASDLELHLTTMVKLFVFNFRAYGRKT